MTLIPFPRNTTYCRDATNNAIDYERLVNAATLFAMAVLRRSKENGDTLLAQGAADFIEVMENEHARNSTECRRANDSHSGK